MIRARRFRPHLVALLLATLLLGWSAHGWHHFKDPTCESGRGPVHECVACSAMHGGVLLGAAVITAAPTRVIERTAYAPPATAAPTAAVHRAAAPRAPPVA